MKDTLLLLLLLISSITCVNGQTVLINEFMAKNGTIINDEDGDFSDWIEIYNPTSYSINLQNYCLSDDNNNLSKWTFPEITILSHSYLLVFASDKNKLDTTELHTNFKISSSGEDLYLSNDLGVVIDHTNSVNLSEDQSYGRIPDGDAALFVINNSSPNSSNNNSNQLLFSNQEGFYTESFPLLITSILSDTIYYTLDGDIPTENSSIYIDSIFIYNKNSHPNIISEIPTTPDQDFISYKAWELPNEIIDKAVILRCASYRNGIRTSRIYTKTFFVDNEIEYKYTMPVISLITEEENLFSPDSGIFVPGLNYDSTNSEWTGNYFMHGDSWERNVHIEYFEHNGNLGFSQDAGIRIHGGLTRQASQKSLRLYARLEYGEKYFNYELLPQNQVNKYKHFILRTTMGAWGGQTIIKDVLAQDISASLNIESQDFRPVIVYVNGEYWGIHTIRDRIDEEYIEYTHNIDKDSVEFKEWGNVAYENLIEFIESNGLESNSNYEYVKTQIDIDNYIDYTIAELFFANYDWPANNMKLWRKIPDGKWRWVLYDLDAGFGVESCNMLVHATKNDTSVSYPNSPSSTFLFRNLLNNEMFQSRFIYRYAEILNNDFGAEIMINKLDSIKEIYSPEILDHIGRWNYPSSFDSWEEDIDNDLLSFVERRPCVVRDNIMTFFDLTEFAFDCELGASEMDVAHLILAPNPNDGKFFIFNDYLDIKNATIVISNINGQLVYKEDNIDLKKNERKCFDLSNLSNNTYVLQIISNNYSQQMKIIVIN